MNPISKLIGSAESQRVEWKESLSRSREITETACAFANTEGGRVFVGVSPEGKMLGVQVGKGTLEELVNEIAQNTDPKLHPRLSVQKIAQKEVIVIDVKESHDHLVLAFGRPYQRVGRSTVRMTKDEYEGLILDKYKDKLYFDEQVCKNAKMTDISREKLFAFVKRARLQRGLEVDEGLSVLEILKRLKLTKNNKLTHAAILLFGKDTHHFFLQSELKAVRFKGLDESRPMLDFKTIEGDAITLLEKAESFIYDHIPMNAWVESGKLERQEKWLYPPDAIREALANALAHRDYRSQGKVQVRIFDDRLEIWNPGALPPSLTVEKLKEKHDSIPYNPLIAKAFFWIKFAEDVGTGTRKMVRWCKEWGLPEPTYEEAGGSFVVIFHRSKREEGVVRKGGQKRWSEKVVRKGDQKLTPRQKKVLNLIRLDPFVSRGTLSEKLGINESAIQKHLDTLKTKELIRRIGPDKGGHWETDKT